jgi:hypothetical protein
MDKLKNRGCARAQVAYCPRLAVPPEPIGQAAAYGKLRPLIDALEISP